MEGPLAITKAEEMWLNKMGPVERKAQLGSLLVNLQEQSTEKEKNINGLITYANQALAKLPADTPTTITLTNLFDATAGQFKADSNSDGWADGWKSSYSSTLASFTAGVQTFTPQQQFANMALNDESIRPTIRAALTNGDIVFGYALVKTTDYQAAFTMGGCTAITEHYHSGNGLFEYIYGIYTVSSNTTFDFMVFSKKAAEWVPIEIKEVGLFKLGNSTITADQSADIVIDNGFILAATHNIPAKVYLGNISEVVKTGCNVAIEVNAASPFGSAGIAMCLDDYVSPTNYLMAYIYNGANGSRIRLKKYVNGAPQLLIDEALTVPTAKIKVEKAEKTIKLYVDGTQIGTDITVADFPIRYGLNHCLFATDSNARFLNFKVSDVGTKALAKFTLGSDLHVGGLGVLTESQYSQLFATLESVEDSDFFMTLGDNTETGYRTTELTTLFKVITPHLKPKYLFRGNHDTWDGLDEIPEHGVVEINGVRIIYFHASLVALPTPPEYNNTGDVTAEELAWIEEQLKVPATHKILTCHWSIVTGDLTNFEWPITDDHGRLEILALAQKYGVKLYINGHEHKDGLPIGKAGVLTDIQVPSLAGGGFAVCSVYADKFVIDLYRPVTPFNYSKTVEIPLI